MTKTNSFVRQFIAAVKGDDVEVQGQKAWRSAESALKVQIAALEGDTIELEDNVDKATEALDAARINGGKVITERDSYIENLFDAKEELVEAEDSLKAHLEELAFLKEEYAKLAAE